MPIYVGRPIFINMSDPIPPQMWAALVRERKDRVELIADRFTEQVAAIERKLKTVSEATRIVDPGGASPSARVPQSDGWGRTVVF